VHQGKGIPHPREMLPPRGEKKHEKSRIQEEFYKLVKGWGKTNFGKSRVGRSSLHHGTQKVMPQAEGKKTGKRKHPGTSRKVRQRLGLLCPTKRVKKNTASD